jgi:thioredoxin-like negative regulator of GroEL
MKVSVLNEETAKDLSKQLQKGDWIVLYYAEWCGHCQHMKPEWDKFKAIAPESVNVAQVESSNIPKLEYNPNVEGYPTIKMYHNNKEVGKFEEERTKEKMLNFVKHHIKTVNKQAAKPVAKPVAKPAAKPVAKPVKLNP